MSTKKAPTTAESGTPDAAFEVAETCTHAPPRVLIARRLRAQLFRIEYDRLQVALTRSVETERSLITKVHFCCSLDRRGMV